MMGNTWQLFHVERNYFLGQCVLVVNKLEISNFINILCIDLQEIQRPTLYNIYAKYFNNVSNRALFKYDGKRRITKSVLETFYSNLNCS